MIIEIAVPAKKGKYWSCPRTTITMTREGGDVMVTIASHMDGEPDIDETRRIREYADMWRWVIGWPICKDKLATITIRMGDSSIKLGRLHLETAMERAWDELHD